MKELNAAAWCDLLWRHFEPIIRTGAPVYLSVDSALLREIAGLNESEFSPLDVACSFHDAVRELFDISYSRARVKEAAFRNISGKTHSLVMVLAVQQVLVVEAMLHDETSEISENAYFPRYRECLGLDDVEAKSNPLVGSQFRQIWDKLEQELMATAGATQQTITFFAGSGPDLNRRLPFTQALLTTHDLTVIKERVPTLSARSDDVAIWHSLYRIRSKFGRRAQKLITSSESSLRERICKQVQSFLEFFEQLSTLRERGPGTRGEILRLVAYLDRGDLFDDELFNLFLYAKDQQRPVSGDETQIQSRLFGSAFIPLFARGDRYIELDRSEAVEPGDGVLLLFKEANLPAVEVKLMAAFGSAGKTLFTSRAVALNGYSLLACEALPGSGIEKLFAGMFSSQKIRRLELVGGLMADERSRVYVSGYPPEGLQWDGKPIAPDATISVSGVPRAATDFFNNLSADSEFSSYRVRMFDEEITFAVAARSAEPTLKQLGYPLVDKELSPSAGPVENDQAALLGVVVRTVPRAQSDLTSEELEHGLVFPLLRGEQRQVALDTERQRFILGRLEALELPKEVALMVRGVVEKGSIPFSPLVRRIAGSG